MKNKVGTIVLILILVSLLVVCYQIIDKQSVKKLTLNELVSNSNTDEIDNKTETENGVESGANAVIDVNESNFESEVLNSNKKVLIDFYADWCGPCNKLSPIVDKVAEENEDIKVVRIDVDQNEELMNKFNVRSIPALIVIEDGKEITRSIGLVSEDRILSLLGENQDPN